MIQELQSPNKLASRKYAVVLLTEYRLPSSFHSNILCEHTTHTNRCWHRLQLAETGKLLTEAEDSFARVGEGAGGAAGTIVDLSGRLQRSETSLTEADKERRLLKAEAGRLRKVRRHRVLALQYHSIIEYRHFNRNDAYRGRGAMCCEETYNGGAPLQYGGGPFRYPQTYSTTEIESMRAGHSRSSGGVCNNNMEVSCRLRWHPPWLGSYRVVG